uniref:Dishevelled segment polarity protein 2 n=1 Tax=Sphenodon punctatus TaxID=8508 RepID=A0A8D0HTA1_SPHPU
EAPPPPPPEPQTEPSPPPPPLPPLPVERTSGIGDSRPPSFHPNISGSRENLEHETETESVVSLRRERPRRREGGQRLNGPSRLERHLAGYESSSTLLSSEIESTSLCDSDDDDAISRQPHLSPGGGIPVETAAPEVNDINFENMSNDDAVRVLREIVHKPGPIVLTVAKCWDPSPQGYFTLPRSEYPPPASLGSEPAPPRGERPWIPFPQPALTMTLLAVFPIGFDDFNLSIHTDMASVTKAMASPESGLEVRDRMWLKITIPNAFLGSDVVDWLYHHVEGFQDRREARKYASNLLKAGFIRHTVNKITFSEQCYYIFGDLSGCENYMANLSLNDNDGSSGASDQDTLAPLPLPGATPWPLMPTFSYQYPAPHPYSTQPPPYHELSSYSYGMGSAGSQHSEGSRSSGSNRSDGAGGGSGRGAGKPKEEKAVGGESKSGSGSESEYSTRSGSQRGGAGEGAAQRSQHSLGAGSVRSHHSLHAAYTAPGGVPLPYNPMMVMMLPPPAPPSAAVAVQPPGAPPVRDLGSVPPELTASRQSFHMAMGNPSEFFVDVM